MRWNLTGICAVCWVLSQQSVAAESALDAYLADCDRRFSEEHAMLGTSFTSPGYHTTVPDGTWVHPTRQSLDYALALLQRRAGTDAQRAARIVEKVLSLQDTDVNSRTYGIWPWVLEEPLSRMSPPDWNWADFCGARLAMILHDSAAILPQPLLQNIKSGLGHAAQAIRKRNVRPDYTNIAIMGGGVCAAAGELLPDDVLLAYGRERLQGVVDFAARNGGFQEYNSPTYTMVALYETERTLHLVRDEATRAAAESLRQRAWETISVSFHPGTQQWAGPHARSYSDYLFASVAEYLTQQTGTRIVPHPSEAGNRMRLAEILPHLPCPESYREAFQDSRDDLRETRRTFLRGQSEDDSLVGITCVTGDACLGTINRGSFWTQQRPVIAYWRTGDDPAVVFRIRFFHDGRDFASMAVRTSQQQMRALVLVHALRNAGDWHPTLDRPRDGIFLAEDLRLRFELRGKGVRVESMGEHRFALVAGERRAVIHPLPGRFADADVAWVPGSDQDCAFVDAVCYHGAKREFDFRSPPQMELGGGIELLLRDEPITEVRPSWARESLGEAIWTSLRCRGQR
jgi:hypothetical protein